MVHLQAIGSNGRKLVIASIGKSKDVLAARQPGRVTNPPQQPKAWIVSSPSRASGFAARLATEGVLGKPARTPHHRRLTLDRYYTFGLRDESL